MQIFMMRYNQNVTLNYSDYNMFAIEGRLIKFRLVIEK